MLTAKGVGIVALPFIDGMSIELPDMAYTPNCNVNLISFD